MLSKRYSELQQAGAIWLSHLVIFFTALAVTNFLMGKGLPRVFTIAEIAIVVLFLLLMGDWTNIFREMAKIFLGGLARAKEEESGGFDRNASPRLEESQSSTIGVDGSAISNPTVEKDSGVGIAGVGDVPGDPRVARRRARAAAAVLENRFPVAFAVGFALQYVALTSLLQVTGGPIGSPFSQLAIAFAVFVPLLATEAGTIVIAVTLSVTYNAVMVAKYGFGPALPINHQSTSAFVVVTTMIAVLTALLTVIDRRYGEDLAKRSEEINDGSTQVG